ncbi:hypothetical protein MJT46_005882 [Ovis ammon polii x Ovis aries]|nr:hypothetical protein MJT46_005882 [Ovis ammon polii x Ovis aries]
MVVFCYNSFAGTTRPHKEGEVPGVDYIFITVEDFMELEKSGALLESGTYEAATHHKPLTTLYERCYTCCTLPATGYNYYGTPKPPAEPAPLLLNVTDQILPGATPSAEGKRKRNKSVSNMEKASIEPPEEEEEERPVVNGNGVVVTPESSEPEDKSVGASGETPSQPYPAPVYSQPEEVKEQMDDAKPAKPEENEDSDPLPDNWEMAYTEKGEVYFIDDFLQTAFTLCSGMLLPNYVWQNQHFNPQLIFAADTAVNAYLDIVRAVKALWKQSAITQRQHHGWIHDLRKRLSLQKSAKKMGVHTYPIARTINNGNEYFMYEY